MRVSGRLTANNGEALLAAALAGMGLIFMPTFIAGEDLRAPRLRWVMREWSDAEDVSIHAIYPANRNLSPKVRVFVDFLAGRTD